MLTNLPYKSFKIHLVILGHLHLRGVSFHQLAYLCPTLLSSITGEVAGRASSTRDVILSLLLKLRALIGMGYLLLELITL